MDDARKRYNAKVKANHLCRNCGKPLDREGAYCTKCLPKQNKTNREDKNWFVSNGICPRCRKERIYGDERACPECRAKLAKDTAEMRNADRQKYNKYMRGYSKNLYRERAEKGLCVRCGKRKPDEGMKTCGICREKRREIGRRNYKPKNLHRGEEGYCSRCGKPIENKQYRVCNACAEQNRINAKKSSTKNHYWRKLNDFTFERKNEK